MMRHFSGKSDTAPILSITCSYKHMKNQSNEAWDILAPMHQGMEAVAAARGLTMKQLEGAMNNLTVREILEMLSIPDELIKEVDYKLHNMVNRIG